MKIRCGVVAAAAVACVVCAAHVDAGDLTPPPGPVGPTGKTLTQVEPRVELSQANTPGNSTAVFVIDEPGSYYLSSNVTAPAGANGIIVFVRDVTIDLNGFTFSAAPGQVAKGGTGPHGIVFSGFPRNIEVRNGSFVGWPGSGILASTDGGRYIDLRFENCNAFGIDAAEGFTNTIERCLAFECGDPAERETGGFRVNRGVIRDSIARNCVNGFVTRAIGNVIENCFAVGSIGTASGTGDGFRIGGFTSLRDCVASANAGDGFEVADQISATFEGCDARENLRNGFLLIDADITNGSFGSVTFEGCRSIGNSARGFSLSTPATLERCSALQNGQDGISGFAEGPMVFRDTRSIGNLVFGVFVGDDARFTRCDVTSNVGQGLIADDRAVVIDCNINRNGGSGLTLGVNARVEGTSVIGNGQGATFADGAVLGEGGVVRGCTFDDNLDYGLILGEQSLVEGNSFRRNGEAAVLPRSIASIVDNDFFFQELAVEIRAGISGVLIERNRFVRCLSNVSDLGFGNVIAPQRIGDAAVDSNTNPNANIDVP